MGQAKQLINRTLIYACGNIMRGLASFIMLPVYTTFLTPKDYGVIELISVILDLTILMLGARVSVGIFKYYSDAGTQKDKNQVVFTALSLMFSVHLFAVLLIAGFSQPISRLVGATDDFSLALTVYSIAAVFAAVNDVYLSYLRALDHAITYVSINFLKLILQLGLNIFLIVYMKQGYWGVVLSAVLSSAAISLLFVVWKLPSIGLHFSRYYAKKLVSFSYPIILTSLAMYYITFGDRYFIKYFFDVATVGVYALAYKFGFMLLSLVASPFSEYWSAKQFEIAKTKGADRFFGEVFFYLAFVMLGAATGMLALLPDFLHMTASPDYWSALPIIPWVAGAYIVLAWSDYFRFGFFHSSRNEFIAVITFATVVVITVLYLAWIPEQAGLGAAKATFFAFVLRFALLYYYGQRLFFIRVPWIRLFSCITYFCLVLYAISAIPMHGLAAFFVKGLCVIASLLLALTTPMIDRDHRDMIYQQIRRGWQNVFS